MRLFVNWCNYFCIVVIICVVLFMWFYYGVGFCGGCIISISINFICDVGVESM